MNKYELALVVSAKIDDDARTAVVDKAKASIEKAGGTITNVDENGKLQLRSKQVFVLWNLFSDIFVLDRTQSNS